MGNRAAEQSLAVEPPLAWRPLTLVLLALVFAVNFMDRQIVAILSEPIRREFDLSDTQVGLLYGLAFGVVYSAAGIPLARWADRANRATVINVCLAVFSAMTIACGLAMSYAQLLLARIGVAVGEGGTNPASHSLIADLYPEARRGTAMAVFALGPNAGIVLAFAFGGALGQAWGWRSALVAMGAAGLALALLGAWLLEDAPRKASRAAPLPGTLAECLRALFALRSMRHLLLAVIAASIAVYAAIGWLPAFLMRSHGMGTASAGLALAVLLGVLGAVGTLAGGVLADRLGARDPAWRLGVVAVGFAAAVPLWAAALIVPHTAAALACLVLPAALLCFYLAPTFAAIQSLAAPGMRALAAALFIMIGSVAGLGIGPVAVGMLSDALRGGYGADSLRLAMLVIVPLLAWSAAHFHLAGRSLAADLARR
jgi:predicted MFS family arabinose efflux permease